MPSGDGLCIALLNYLKPYDVDLLIALDILDQLSQYNEETIDEKRRFQVRIGINENVDNLITDFNGRRNTAGAGINLARRIMDKSDGGQILVSGSVYERLSHRDKYEAAFKGFPAKGKHGEIFTVYQFIMTGHNGINLAIPSVFKPRGLPRLTELVAYYMAHAIENRDYFLSKIKDPGFEYASIVVLYFRALDSIGLAKSTPYGEYTKRTQRAGEQISEQYDYYRGQDFWVIAEFSTEIVNNFIRYFSELFEKAEFITKYSFVNAEGVSKS